MVENLALQDSKDSSITDLVDNLPNTVIATEVSERISSLGFANTEEGVESSYSTEEGDGETSDNPVASSNREQIEITEQNDVGFEHFFDDDFGQTRQSPSHDEPSVSGLK